jgi:hypothetical protein
MHSCENPFQKHAVFCKVYHLYEFILEQVKDRENRPTYYRMISTQSIQQLRISLQNWMKNENFIYLSNIQNYIYSPCSKIKLTDRGGKVPISKIRKFLFFIQFKCSFLQVFILMGYFSASFVRLYFKNSKK